MPNRDGTGPLGKGPMTGRGMGNCILPVGKVSFKDRFFRRLGRGLGFGRCRGLGPGRGRETNR